MPKIKIDNVLSFSTEDPNHPASNLLLPDPAKKWKCAKAGEKNATVILQLEKATQIASIDIGNEGSAYIEVLVSRSSSDEFKVLLGMSSFMTAFESRNNQNVNQVRMFASSDFSSPERDEKWDRVKFVCIQPFNKHFQYGLSFITIHSSEGSQLQDKKAAGFLLRPSSPNAFAIGSLFSREKATESSPKGAVAIREASNNPEHLCSSFRSPLLTKLNKKVNLCDDEVEDDAKHEKNRNRNDLLYDELDEAPNDKIDKLIEQKRKEHEKNETKMRQDLNDESKTQKTFNLSASTSLNNDTPKEMKKRRTDCDKKAENQTPKKQKIETQLPSCSKTPDEVNNTPSTKTKKESVTKVKPKRQTKPFERLLEGVVVVISGIQNPERANLRRAAISLGAKYKPDWNDSCTHLICAFANTPKFRQVRGKGKIVRKQWILECEAKRQRIPWRRFALDPSDQSGEESEEEICEQTDAQSDNDGNGLDESEVVQTNQEENIQSTIEDIIVDVSKLPSLPNHFADLKFYLSPKLDIMVRQLKQYIIAYGGEIIYHHDLRKQDESMIAVAPCAELNEIRELSKKVDRVVSPIWILECNLHKKLVRMGEFLIYSARRTSLTNPG